MTDLDDQLVPRVRTIVDKFGISATFTEVQNNYSYVTGDNVQSGPPTHVALITPPKITLKFDDDDATCERHARCFFAEETWVPSDPRDMVGWTVLSKSVTYKILKVFPADTGELTAGYGLEMMA